MTHVVQTDILIGHEEMCNLHWIPKIFSLHTIEKPCIFSKLVQLITKVYIILCDMSNQILLKYLFLKPWNKWARQSLKWPINQNLESEFVPTVSFFQFTRSKTDHNSTHRVDFRNYGSHRPDVIVRRKALLRNDGLGQENLFYHHGNKYTNNMLSWYDEHYNGRWKENVLPPSRQWNSHNLAWGPEKSDYPLQGKVSLFLFLFACFL